MHAVTEEQLNAGWQALKEQNAVLGAALGAVAKAVGLPVTPQTTTDEIVAAVQSAIEQRDAQIAALTSAAQDRDAAAVAQEIANGGKNGTVKAVETARA